ncbi:putative ribosomal large subunit pseudouridine synthase C protein [Tieghemostelium lacteum]|uniref:Putative ribosomal large subunit pseudouridine synthase C protein n=1 Tax=Tieghemostelium lacteum TaxID=361077 RepID=A0A151ZCY8_TIELA|nr:putative ribosomal large subunit pseudouridine synthase C protein [Tieghemostelium lacteum]|eukprot:KYQ91816.1 putative ribosomal large subunit pseudouridine synthase C protein [Tieghemostelium lacteum]
MNKLKSLNIIFQNCYINSVYITRCYAFGKRINRNKIDSEKKYNPNDRNKSLRGIRKSIPKEHTIKLTKDIKEQEEKRLEDEQNSKKKNRKNKKIEEFINNGSDNLYNQGVAKPLEHEEIYTDDGKFIIHKITSENSEMRMDRWIKNQYPILTHSFICKLLREGVIYKSTSMSGTSDKMHINEIDERTVEGTWIFIPSTISRDQKIADIKEPKKYVRLSPEEIKGIVDSVLYKDSDILVINKPPGLSVQGGTGLNKHLDMMLSHLKFDNADPPKLIHRLDRDTSGILILGRNRKSTALMADKFELKLSRSTTRQKEKTTQTPQKKKQAKKEEENEELEENNGIVKTYWALLSNTPTPKEGRIRAPLKKIVENGKEKVITTLETGDGAKLAITEYKVIQSLLSNQCFIELTPETGRTHQLRVHCASILKSPIIGDYKYGVAGDFQSLDKIIGNKIPLHLHARRVVFTHPLTNKKIDIVAPLPKTLQESWKLMGFNTNLKTE